MPRGPKGKKRPAKPARKSATRKPRVKKARLITETLRTRIVMTETEDAPLFYANYAEVAHSQHEFALLGVRVPAKLSEEQMSEAKSTGTLTLPIDFQIVLPPTVIPGLIDALKNQLALHKEIASENLLESKEDDDAK